MTESVEAGADVIRAFVKTLPSAPGVYRMIDAAGEVMYVGKARSLKARVTNYTRPEGLEVRLQRKAGLVEGEPDGPVLEQQQQRRQERIEEWRNPSAEGRGDHGAGVRMARVRVDSANVAMQPLLFVLRG